MTLQSCIVNRILFLVPLTIAWQHLQAQDLRQAYRVEHPGRAMTVLVASPDGQSVVAGDDKGTLYLFRKEDGKETDRWEGHRGDVRSIAFNSTGRLMLTTAPGELRIWSLPDRTLLHQLTDPRFADIRFSLFAIADGFIYFS